MHCTKLSYSIPFALEGTVLLAKTISSWLKLLDIFKLSKECQEAR